jgi:AraC-like DNA-binding protein
MDLALLRQRFPAVPLFVYGFVRPDEADFVLQLYDRFGAAALLVEGVDDAAAPELIGRGTTSARRRVELANLPRVLRLTERLQLDAFAALESQNGGRASTAMLASKLNVSREHLSRQFGAGGAPNLKRVLDFFQVITARDLLQNPGYPLGAVAGMVGYSTPSHLQSVARRVVGLGLRDLPKTPNAELIRRFVAIGARSRR